MKTKLIILAAVLAALLGGWYFVSPGYAMMQLRDAAEAGDAAEMEERIDFPAVRQSLKDDLKAKMAQEMGAGSGEGAGPLGAAFAMALIDPMIDGFVTPEAMAGLVEKGEMASPASRLGANSDNVNAEQAPEWEIVRNGFSSFTARPKSRESGQVPSDAPGLVFDRDGLGWRLVEIEIPEG